MVIQKLMFFTLLLLFYSLFNLNNVSFNYKLKIYNKPNSGGLGNKLLGISSTLILSFISNKQLICI